MGLTKRKRKFLYILGFVFLVFIALLIASPLWFPWILKPVLKNYGVQYSKYERKGYNRVILHDAKFARPKVNFQAGQIEILFPATFLWRNFKNDDRENYLRVSNWTLELIDTVGKKPSTNSVFHASKKLDGLLEELNRWLPKATLEKGAIHFKDKTIAISSADWAGGNLSGRIISEKFFPETFFNAHLGKDVPKKILIENPAWNLGGEIIVAYQEDKALRIDGSILWRSNQVDLAAQFLREGWLPETASIRSESFRVPAKMLRLEGYRSLAGALDVRWATNQFAIDLTARAKPIQEDETVLPPVEAIVHASGDTNSVRMETATLSSPWLTAKLSKNAEFSFRGELLSDTAVLSLAADLSEQKWIAAKGKLNGQAILRPSKKRFPNTTFSLSGTEIDVQEIQINRLDLEGNLDWPWLQVGFAKIDFKDGATAEANLKFNAVARLVSKGRLKLDGSVGHKFLPPEISYQHVSLDAEFSGPLKNISHSARVELEGLKLPKMMPLKIVTDWRASRLDFKELNAKISADNLAVAFSGSVDAWTNQFTAQIQKLALTKDEQPLLNLQKPFGISATNSGSGSLWAGHLDPVQMRGEKTVISLGGNIQWPERGNVSVSVREFDPSQFRDFFNHSPPEGLIKRLNISAKWTNGPLDFAIDSLARFASEDGTLFFAELQTAGNGNGVSIERAHVGTASEAVLSGKGFLPIAIMPANKTNLLHILPGQKIDFQAATTPNPQFWDRIAAWTQTAFQEPEAAISISGTLDAPQGKITARAKEVLIKPREPDQPMPRLQDFSADIDLVRERIVLNRFEVFVEGQPVTATGELPLPENLQAGWRKVFDWRKANARLKIVDAQIAPFERLFPKILSPLGTVNLDLAINDQKLDGELRVENAALRPIAPIGPVHDVAARVKFVGEQISVQSFQGSIGGENVNLTGEANLAKRDAVTGLPAFNFKLHGTNVPLARSPDLILRSDLDLGISNEKGGQPLVSGTLGLRKSFYLSDPKVLIPGKVSKPKQRPPYFSVEVEPFAKWRLDVAVKSTEFLNVRSPLFRGEISSNLKVEGTLKEPIAIGDVRIESGVIQFPFSSLRVDQGFISLTSANPYSPQLSITASARTFGYDIKMDLSGPAEEPAVEFSSTPGLTSEQILLMVTAGELPRDEVNFSTQQKAGRLAFFLGKNLFSKFGATSAGEDRLEIRSGENISEEGRQTYYLEYKLSEDWSIVGEYDRYGALNAGLKWKFFAK